ncbi:helix-turn-helix domain-containing protein [Bacteroidales bacterium OttesenSCG-928-B11]|nr:helix-turn-helix domain-containing protein [Bacteroidales bacterium OttesenSCG-928-E04]MDL2308864.1 helix-turn-helix domain-containing protein [Bacteroidales bacterium OttesenSCG-928-C03]MDL2312827.1 helix-turn-helix domain-containing protein [Bacteroidales bacterium OttesenSCG-928-B11]MDL2312833.1 helix-turn-helix domain-containing protein [Bacteroidales bacterium OttesenSCG-928-B11]MDL2325848.1 helix-turn-helix domain-containing protein [Bacteroidales bacterium OttesenSCG-928-A14]
MNDYSITLEELGKRLKEIRVYLGLNQMELAEKIDSTQVAVSRLERGAGGTIAFFTTVVSFYSQHIYINCLFSKHFSLIPSKDASIDRSYLETVVEEIINTALEKHENENQMALDNLRTSLKRAVTLIN